MRVRRHVPKGTHREHSPVTVSCDELGRRRNGAKGTGTGVSNVREVKKGGVERNTWARDACCVLPRGGARGACVSALPCRGHGCQKRTSRMSNCRRCTKSYEAA